MVELSKRKSEANAPIHSKSACTSDNVESSCTSDSSVSRLSDIDKTCVTPILPNGKFKTVYLDPPWDIQQRGMRGAEKHYDLMTIDELKAMPIPDLVEEDAHMWMWTTNAALPYAFELLEAWGFTYRSIMTYCKMTMGLGNYLRNSSEQILLATRGKCPILYHSQYNWDLFPRQEHSRKPCETYDVIERCSPGPYLELFARHSDKYPKRDSTRWSYWGNEIESDIVIPGMPVPSYSDKVKNFLAEQEAKAQKKVGEHEC